MKAVTKYLAGAAAAAALTLGAAAPAAAQDWGQRSNMGVGDIVNRIGVLGGLAAILGAVRRDRGQGYGNRYGNDYRTAVNACAQEAQRFGGGRVSVTEINRRGYDGYRVHGVIETGYGNDRRYEGRYDRRYDDRYGDYRRDGRYDDRYGDYRRDGRSDDRYGDYRRDGRYDDRYSRRDGAYGRHANQAQFECTVRADGRIVDFDIDRA